MRYKQGVILLLLLIAITSTRSDDQSPDNIRTEQIKIGKQIDDILSENQLAAYYKLELEKIHSNQDLVVVVKGKTPFDDPEVRLAYAVQDFVNEQPESKVYTCQNVGREICIIPGEDLIEKKKSQEQIKVYIEVTQRSGENCHYVIEVEYEEKLVYQFGKEYTIQLKQDMYKQIALKFDNIETSELSNIFASIIPLEQGLINDKIEFSAKQGSIVINGISIWENGLGLAIRNQKFTKDSEIQFTIYSSSQQSFLFQTTSTKASISLELQEISKGYLFQEEVATYKIDLNKAKQKNHENFDLILNIHPYFGRATIQVFTKDRYQEKADPNWTFEAWGSEQIVLKAQDRLKYTKQDDFYYIKVIAKTELTYSLKAYLFDKDQLTIEFHDSVVGLNSKDELTNYLLKIVSVDVIQVRVMLFNIAGDNDIFIKKCETQKNVICKVTEKEIKDYEKSENKDNKNIFIAVKVGDSKREFITFTHKSACEDKTSCKYVIALKGTTDSENKYALRVGNDAQHVLLQNNIPFKDQIAKFDINFYKFVSPAVGTIEQIDFIITPFLGSAMARASTLSQYPRMHDFEKQSNEQKVITYTKKDYNLSEKTFYLSVFGETDAIFTITPHITFDKNENFDQEPGILIVDGIKQVIVFSQKQPKKYFYLKVPVDSNNKVPKLSLNLLTTQGAYYRVYLDSSQKIIQETPENARFKNQEVDTQITIQDGTLEGEMLLFGMIQSLHQNKDENELNSLILYYHTDFVAFQFELNLSHVHLFHKKKTQYFSFQIKKNTKYYISVITNAKEQYNLDFYLSLDNRITKPNNQHNTAKFKAFEGFVIDQDLLDRYCPFLNQEIKEDQQSCNVALAGYAYTDVLATITISNDGSIFQLFEGINFRTALPLPNEFSYFFHDIMPGVEHTKIEVTSSSSHLQIYARIYVIIKDTQDLILKKQNFPTSQRSEYQSNLDIFSQQSAIIQIHSKDKEGCQMNTCKVLITVDNLDKKVNENKQENYMNLLVTNDKSVLELVEGKDFPISNEANQINYFKYYVGSDIKNLKFELLINDNEQNNQEQFGYNYILVSNSTQGLPTFQTNKYLDIMNNMIDIRPDDNQVYISQGMYYFGVMLSYNYHNVFARLTSNQNQIINLSLDGIQRIISLQSQEVAYTVFSLHEENNKASFEFFILNPNSEYKITLYADNLYQRINGIREIEDIVKRNQVVGQMSKDIHRIQFSHDKKNYHYVAKIESQIRQKITFLLRAEETIQALLNGSYFKDVIQPKKMRIFDLQSEKCIVKLTIFSGQIQISLINPQDRKGADTSSWLEKKEVIHQITFSKEWNNVLEIPIQKSQNRTSNDLLLIENLNEKNDAFYFIENIDIDYYKKFDPNLLPGHPRSGSLRQGDSVSYSIQNLGLVKTVFKLSIFFPSFHFREQFNSDINMPNVTLSALKANAEFNIIDQKRTQSQIYFEFEINQGTCQLNITKMIEDNSLSNLDDDFQSILEYVVSLDTQGIMHVIDDVKYYQTQSSKFVNTFEYFREWGTPFIVEIFDCAGDTTLALSESLAAVKEFSSDLVMRQKNFGNYKFYTFSTFDAQKQEEEDYNNNPEDDFIAKSSILYIGAKPRSLDPKTKKAEYIIRAISFPSDNHQAFMLPFDSFYIKNDSILVEEIGEQSNKGLRFSAQNIRCEQGCLQIRAKVNYVTYELYLASSLHSLQEYSVCHTNLTNYKDLNQQYFTQAESNNGFLLIRKAVKSLGLAEKANSQATFNVTISELTNKPTELYYTIVATVNIKEYGSQKSQNVPIFYKKEKLSNGWYKNCVECQNMKKEIEKDEQEKENKNLEENNEESSESNFYSISLIFIFILLGIIGLYSLYRIFVYCKNKGHYSLKNIFSNTASSFELNQYHQHDSYN
ncbi:transmembrane protein, putative (macronuclear) [Tetrahymena thermophila SB210]|uniref:Transmembrane protein, putative n=1 Tax=Tetrahymena thermophila (strain SB210) TaxID=312017 RepID=I7LX38_TETTS|nr:transmembrane protein, putative [Tetrahymena thermophila SB210]EAS03702.2 transmembrane protein, putative [Tetrahymena thermophila SB210]|eukprot:XP_001023947.2 transmembrane protein, putative [Tetrahymena thermophila SB210]